MVERQPRHQHVGRRRLDQDGQRIDLGLERAVGERHGLWRDRRPRGELDQAEVAGPRGRRGPTGGAVEQPGGVARPERRPGPGDRLAEEPPRPSAGDHQPGTRGADHPSRALDVLLEPAEPHRRVERHRHRAGPPGTEEGVQEGHLGPEHDRDPIPGPHAPRRIGRGGASGPGDDLPPRMVALLLGPIHEGDAAWARRGGGEGVDQRGVARRRRRRPVKPGQRRAGTAHRSSAGSTAGRRDGLARSTTRRATSSRVLVPAASSSVTTIWK